MGFLELLFDVVMDVLFWRNPRTAWITLGVIVVLSIVVCWIFLG